MVIGLSPRDVLRKKIVLPAAVEENFLQALGYDLDRHTPFKADELYYDATVVDRTPARGTITVDLAAARRAVVDPLLRHVATWGADVVAVVPESPRHGGRVAPQPAAARAPHSRAPYGAAGSSGSRSG